MFFCGRPVIRTFCSIRLRCISRIYFLEHKTFIPQFFKIQRWSSIYELFSVFGQLLCIILIVFSNSMELICTALNEWTGLKRCVRCTFSFFFYKLPAITTACAVHLFSMDAEFFSIRLFLILVLPTRCSVEGTWNILSSSWLRCPDSLLQSYLWIDEWAQPEGVGTVGGISKTALGGAGSNQSALRKQAS